MEFERKAHLKMGEVHPNIKPDGIEFKCKVDPYIYKNLMESAAYLAHDAISPFVRPVIKPSHIKQIIFNAPATILILHDGRKIVSKAHVEEFDKEKGLLMCLCKANGITHLELKKLIDGAVDQTPKPKVDLKSLPGMVVMTQEEYEKFWRGE